MLFSFFESPFWRGLLWIGSFLALNAVLGFETTVIIALATIAMQQRKKNPYLF
tara:strand:- start:2727 stop:2885 length:159 start_codon:yes stop_codon:yes gene_type:complete